MHFVSCEQCGRVYDMEHVKCISTWVDDKSDMLNRFAELSSNIQYENYIPMETWQCTCGNFVSTGRPVK